MTTIVHWNGTAWAVPNGGGGTVDPLAVTWDWSDINQPWAYPADLAEREALFKSDWDTDLTYVTIPLTGDFATNVATACNAASGPVIIQLAQATYHIKSFPLAGTSGRQDFAYGIYHPKLLGFLGLGPDKSIIQMDANSMSTAQLNYLATLDPADFAPNAMGCILMQPSGTTKKVHIAGVGFRAEDQQNLPGIHPNLALKGVVANQPAPHTGMAISPDRDYLISYCAFVGFGRAIYAAPPFEHPNLNSQYATGVIHHTDLDGRRHPDIDPARPRRCTVFLGNNEDSSTIRQSWMHHTNVSRYAINDQNRDTGGTYTVKESKVEFIGNGNFDPALNGGAWLGGSSMAVCLGFESSRATVVMRDIIADVNNVYSGQGPAGVSQHIGFAHVTDATNRVGGKLYVYGGTWKNSAYPSINGFLCIRAYPTVAWYTSGVANTMFVYPYEGGPRKTAWVYTGAWPPSSGQIAAAGATPATHFIVRPSGS